MKTPLADILRFLGVRSTPAATDQSQHEEIRLYLMVPDRGRLLVGSLRRDRDEFVFEYAPEFVQSDLPTLPDFPSTTRAYRSSELWPFFLVRLPPADRADVQREISDQGIEPANTFALLGRLGRRTISSPYELELAHVN